MKNKVIVFLLVAIVGCTNGNYNADAINDELNPKFARIDSFVRDIENKHPNVLNNSILKRRAADYLKAQFDSIKNYKIMEDVPLKVLGIIERGNKAYVFLYFNNINGYNSVKISSQTKYADRLKFEVMAITNLNAAASIDKNERYFIKSAAGSKYTRITDEQANVSRLYYGDKVEITKDIIYDYPNYNAGLFKCSVDSFILVE